MKKVLIRWSPAISLMLSMSLFAQSAPPTSPADLALKSEKEDDNLFDYKINDLSVTTRYRAQQNAQGDTTHDRVQLKLNLDFTFKFFDNRVEVNLQGGTGSTFGSAWSDTGIGDANQNIDINLRRLSVTLKPSDLFSVEAGSMAPQFGAGSDNTYLDSDGYLMGYRAKVTYDKTDLIMTGGFLGDFADPNVFNRGERMGDFNYFQILLQRKLSEILTASLDYTYMNDDLEGGVRQNVQMPRGALNIDVSKWTPLVDSMMGEWAHGFREAQDDFDLFALTGSKKINDIEFLGKRDAKISVSYLYRTEAEKGIPFPLEDKGYEGSSYRIRAQLLDLLNGRGPGNWTAGLDWLQSVDDCDQWRCEISIGWKF